MTFYLGGNSVEEKDLKQLEDKLWAAADKMRGAVSVSDYKFIILGLIFLKYISCLLYTSPSPRD